MGEEDGRVWEQQEEASGGGTYVDQQNGFYDSGYAPFSDYRPYQAVSAEEKDAFISVESPETWDHDREDHQRRAARIWKDLKEKNRKVAGKEEPDSGFSVTLNPMQIRTFVVEVKNLVPAASTVQLTK